METLSEAETVRRLELIAGLKPGDSFPQEFIGYNGWGEALSALTARAAEIIKEHDQSFELRWNADMRAIKRWQAAHPGKDLVWPDHADLCVWLLGQLEVRHVQAAKDEAIAEFAEVEQCPNSFEPLPSLQVFNCMEQVSWRGTRHEALPVQAGQGARRATD